jgi:hypothetical protein
MPGTGDPSLDFVLEAGPRVVTPDTPEHVVKELGKYKAFEPLREEMKQRKLKRLALINAIIDKTCVENRELEERYKATPNVLPYARIPMDLIIELEAENNRPWDSEMREHTLKCYPGLLLNVRLGINGVHNAGR